MKEPIFSFPSLKKNNLPTLDFTLDTVKFILNSVELYWVSQRGHNIYVGPRSIEEIHAQIKKRTHNTKAVDLRYIRQTYP